MKDAVILMTVKSVLGLLIAEALMTAMVIDKEGLK
jgi:hypothetical protein